MVVRDILTERKKTHGEYNEHARITQELKRCMEGEQGWYRLNDGQREALAIIAHKIGRILCGNPNFKDHWDDIAGYATLVADRVNQGELFIPGTPEDGGHHARYQPELDPNIIYPGKDPEFVFPEEKE